MRIMSCMKKDASSRIAAENDHTIYHERQSRELCALHSLNNLFQAPKTFTKKQLDEICLNLSPSSYVNPHRSFLGLGNYDVNVIMAALGLMGYDTVWFDKRRNLSQLRPDVIFGFILNVPTDLKLGILHVPLQRKHWIAVRKVNDQFYNLDSKLDSPELIGNDDQLIAYLKEQVQCKDKELLFVVNKLNHRDDLWKKPRDISGEKLRENAGPAQSRSENSQPSEVDNQFKESGV